MYVHIPYCRRRCRYCDFAIVPIGGAGGRDDSSSSQNLNNYQGFLHMDERYRQAIVQELNLLGSTATTTTIQNNKNNNDHDDDDIIRTPMRSSLSSIYLGGGTPSLAPTITLRAILETIRKQFHVEENVEITMEMDPGTFTEDQLREWKALGINRISLGVQALNDVVLEQIGRIHRVTDIYNTVDMIRRLNITNYSIDLISGLPGVSLAQWADTLETVLRDFAPNHLSIYDLQIEQSTVFGKWYADDNNVPVSSLGGNGLRGGQALPLPSPEDCAYMYKYASGYLRHKGYEHYEISSYAMPNFKSRHNQVYWDYETEWYAVGLGASSFLRNHRFARPRAMSDYIHWVKCQDQSVQHVDWFPNHSSSPQDADPNDRLTDIIMTRLRTSDGLDLNWIQGHYSKTIVDSVIRGAQLGIDLGLAHLDQQKTLRLVDPKGFLFSNSILSSIFVELDDTEQE